MMMLSKKGSTVTMRGYDQNQEPTTLATNLLLDVPDSSCQKACQA